MNHSAESKNPTVRALLADQSTFATVLSAILIREYGPEVYEWDPETIHIQVLDDFGVDLPEINHMKLVSLFSALQSGAFFQDPLVFSSTCEILNGTPSPLDELTTDLLPPEIAWAVMEVRLNDDDKPVFATDVARMVGVILDEEGFDSPPSAIPWALMEEEPGFIVGPDREDWQNQVLAEYMADQARDLFAQLSTLPWAAEIDMARLGASIADETGIAASVADFSGSPKHAAV